MNTPNFIAGPEEKEHLPSSRNSWRWMIRQTQQLPQFLASGLMDLVFPPCCRLCEGLVRTTDDFCDPCLRDLSVTESMMRRSCQRCGIPGAGLAARSDDDESSDCQTPQLQQTAQLHLCPQCHHQRFHFDAVASLWMYRERVCEAIVAAKYPHNAPLADALGRRLGQLAQDKLASDPPNEVAFVPSHLFRQLSRGGIGTRAIAEAVASRLRIPVQSRLKTVRPIKKQAWLDDEGRKENVCGAFALRKSYAFTRSPKLDDRHILLVDDVMTTGATANEVADVLKAAGARRVSVAVVARAVRSV